MTMFLKYRQKILIALLCSSIGDHLTGRQLLIEKVLDTLKLQSVLGDDLECRADDGHADLRDVDVRDRVLVGLRCVRYVI